MTNARTEALARSTDAKTANVAPSRFRIAAKEMGTALTITHALLTNAFPMRAAITRSALAVFPIISATTVIHVQMIYVKITSAHIVGFRAAAFSSQIVTTMTHALRTSVWAADAIIRS